MEPPSDTKPTAATPLALRLLSLGGGHRDSPAAPPRSSSGPSTYPKASPSLALRPRSVTRETAHGYSPAQPPPHVGHSSSTTPTTPPFSSISPSTYPKPSPSFALRPRSVSRETAHGYSPAPPPPHVGHSSSSTAPTAPPCSSSGPSTYPQPSPSLRLPARTFGRDNPHRDSILPERAELFAASENGMVNLIAKLSRMPVLGGEAERRDEVGSCSSETRGDLFVAFFHNNKVQYMASLTFLEDLRESDGSSQNEESRDGLNEEADDKRCSLGRMMWLDQDGNLGQSEVSDDESKTNESTYEESDDDEESKNGSHEEADVCSDDGKPCSPGLMMWLDQDGNLGQSEVSDDESETNESTDEESDEDQETKNGSDEEADGYSDDGKPCSPGLRMWLDQDGNLGQSEVSNDESETNESTHEESDEDSKDDEIHYFLELRMWPSRANLVLTDTTSWVFTKAYCLRWLSADQIEALVHTIHESGYDIAVGESSVLHQLPTGRSRFEGPMVSSRDVENYVERKLSPSILDFHIQKQLGLGATCNVRLCTYKLDGNDYAVKIIRLNEDQIQSEPREVTILSHLRSEFVVKFTQAWVECDTSGSVCYEQPISSSNESSAEICHEPTNPEGCSYLFIQMEYCPRSLQKFLSLHRKVDAQESYDLFEKITKGLKYIHGEGVIHRDLKPGNVFIGTDDVVKIGDFGQPCFRPDDCIFFEGTPNLGTRFYEAPELAAGTSISEKVDIHPLGIMYFELYNCFSTGCGKQRELNELKRSSSKKCLSGKGDPLLCLHMIAVDPVVRPSPDDILESLTKALD